jgi:S-adenosylmethionine:tRNA ribosyltransferase-isomerase
MATDFFDYDLPSCLIAQEPSPQRDAARLLVLDRKSGILGHHLFRELPELLIPGDLLVLNDTCVLPARLIGQRARTGGRWEGLFLSEHAAGLWKMLCQARGRLLPGEEVLVEPGPLRLRLVSKTEEGHWLARPSLAGSPPDLLAAFGKVPLPHYIRKGRASDTDRNRYQTIFARRAGAVAAPTAGLHFTLDLFNQLKQRGIDWTFVTLHVGLGTFQPIQTEDLTRHRMHSEWGELSVEAAETIASCRRKGGRVIAVGTTVVRVLETVATSGPIRPWSGETDLYIYPPYTFRAVDALVTNFHLPRSSLLLLVAAFAGVDLMRGAYKTAIGEQYRFFSYGDAMLIV